MLRMLIQVLVFLCLVMSRRQFSYIQPSLSNWCVFNNLHVETIFFSGREDGNILNQFAGITHFIILFVHSDNFLPLSLGISASS